MSKIGINFCLVLFFSLDGTVSRILGAPEKTIHKRMTPAQVLQTFGTTDVPDYDIVDVHVPNVQKRSTAPIKVKFLVRNVATELSLLPMDGILATENTPVTIATGSGNGGEVLYRDDPNIMRRVGIPYQDVGTKSVIFMSPDRNRRNVLNGYIRSHNMVIRSLPEEYDDPNNYNSHIVFELNGTSFEPDTQNYDLNETMLKSRVTKNKREVQKTIYPEVLAVVDYSSYAGLGSNLVNTIRYVLVLWSLVQVRYSSIPGAKVRINIARIIVATEREGTPYVVNSVYGSGAIDGNRVLKLAGQHFYRQRQEFPFTSYDAIMIMTKSELWSDSRRIGGLADLSGACSDVPYETVRRCGIFYDGGEYLARTPAHEFGHLLGAKHDDEVCPNQDKYIMAMSGGSDDGGINRGSFSTCSLEAFARKFQSDSGCLTNKPMTNGKIIRTILPQMTIAEQCQARGGVDGNTSCRYRRDTSEDICSTFFWCLFPQEPSQKCRQYVEYSLDGTSCGNEGKFCLRGKCVGL